MSEGSHLTTEFRRRAVVAVLDGLTKTAVAAAYGVDRKTIAKTPSPHRCHGSGTSAHFQKNTSMDRRAAAFACISFACVFTGLES